jgi:hypothetical protein
MNLRMQEIAEHSLITVLKLVNDPVVKDGCYIVSPDRLEYFANRIVQECASIVTDAVDQREPASTYADKIKNHFGVEE